MGIREWIVPQDRVFFDYFDRQAEIVLNASEVLVQLMEDFTDILTKAKKIEALEHEGDKITHEIYELLNSVFITPLDPMEISRLASAMDDILDYIDGATQKMINYQITQPDVHMRELAKLIRLSVHELREAVLLIRSIKVSQQIEDRCIEVNSLENIADDVLSHAITDLFKSQDAIMIIKLKDIYEYLEIATDKCEDAANVLSDIAIRHT
ncbi:MAG: DUF47 family protein [Methanomicrobiales archaeon]|nr:DUF47 family protein [Methanomicrobiales archaeon]